jgi:hypothetical protein
MVVTCTAGKAYKTRWFPITPTVSLPAPPLASPLYPFSNVLTTYPLQEGAAVAKGVMPYLQAKGEVPFHEKSRQHHKVEPPPTAFKLNHTALHSLVCNAGIMMTPFGLTTDGIGPP